MNKKIKIFLITLIVFLIFPIGKIAALSFTDLGWEFTDAFSVPADKNEGATTFRSLLIPFGGRTESLGNAYTGLCDDISFLRYNPAAGAIQNETQVSLFHNTWIADSKLETLAYTTRLKNLKNLSLGGYVSCFYVPFSEYNIFGDKTASSYYSETITAFNASYNFFAGYNFKGMAVGANIKTGWRNVPNYTDNDTNLIIPGSGLEQSSFALMLDLGMMFQFNFLKFFASREPNLRIGISAQNLGVALTGFGNKIEFDGGLPTLISLGLSVQFLSPFIITAEVTQPINFFNMNNYLLPYFNMGMAVQFTSFLSMMAGLQIKGGKPTISTGVEFELSSMKINLNYSLDFTTSLAPVNRFSLSTKILLGDRGRRDIRDQVDDFYKKGLVYYQFGEWENAITCWNQALALDPKFDPAILGIKSAEKQLNMFLLIEKSLKLNQDE